MICRFCTIRPLAKEVRFVFQARGLLGKVEEKSCGSESCKRSATSAVALKAHKALYEVAEVPYRD